MKKPHSKYQTQWAAQFAVASELCKRCYDVALTLGNHPIFDLVVRSPHAQKFYVDVKGLYKPAFFPVQQREIREDLFYILAYVPPNQPNEFFVLTHKQVNDAIKAGLDKFRAKHGRESTYPGGVEWRDAQQYFAATVNATIKEAHYPIGR